MPWDGFCRQRGGGKLAIFGEIKRNEPLLQPKWNQKKVKWEGGWTFKVFQNKKERIQCTYCLYKFGLTYTFSRGYLVVWEEVCALHSLHCAIHMHILREHLPKEKMFSFGHCPNEWGGGPCPNWKTQYIYSFLTAEKDVQVARNGGRGGPTLVAQAY